MFILAIDKVRGRNSYLCIN